jgi:phosphoribosyl-ATP pyrophosphohydrolase
MSNIGKVVRVAYDEIREMNDIAGNLTTVDDASIDAQISFCFEETAEVIDAFESGNKAELLKEACDLFVVSVGLLQKLEVAGYDVAKALGRVNANNLSKFPADGELFAYDPAFTLHHNAKYKRQVIKDAVGKFRKPSNYVKADVSDLVPKE